MGNRRGGGGGGRRNGQVPGTSVIVNAVNRAGSFPKPKKWVPKKYPGKVSSQPGKTPSTNALRGQIGNDLATAAARKRGDEIVGSEINIRKPGTPLKGSSNVDHLLRGPGGDYHGLEVKAGEGKLRKAQEEHYPLVPQGGLEVGSHALGDVGMPRGHVLGPGQVASMRVERWDIDSLPMGTKTALEQHTVQAILKGDAGPAQKQALEEWMARGSSVRIDKVWT